MYITNVVQCFILYEFKNKWFIIEWFILILFLESKCRDNTASKHIGIFKDNYGLHK